MRRRISPEFLNHLWVRKVWKTILVFSAGLLMILCLIMMAGIVKQWKSVGWFGHEPYRILVLNVDPPAEPVKITLVNVVPDTSQNIQVDIPTQTTMSSVGGLGTYRVSAFYRLGEIEGVGTKLLKDTIGFSLGVPVHQIFEIPAKTEVIPWGKLKRQVIVEGIMGKRSLPEALKVWKLLSTMGIDGGDKMSLSQDNALRTRLDVDGATNYYLEPALLDRFMFDNLPTIWKEAATMQVAVINASGKTQMATQWSRLARIGGYDVISVADQQVQADSTTLLFQSKDLMNLEAGKSLMRLYPLAQVVIGDTTEYRSEVALVVGLDSWRWLNEREEYLSQKLGVFAN